MTRKDALGLFNDAETGTDLLEALDLIAQEPQPVVSNDTNN